MILMFKRLSIATQALVFLLLMMLGTVSALYFWANDNASGLATTLRRALDQLK